MRRVRKHDIPKLNNKGLSLVEVLVAVIIMSVVSIIFLRSFSYSMIINRDAEEKQDALTLGQSIMEAVKAYDLAKLDDEFQSGGAISIINNATGATAQSASTDASGKRTYTLTQVPFANNKFDAEVVITPNTGLYSDTMLTIEDFNHYNDAYFRQDPYEQDTVRNEILDELKNAGYTGNDLNSGANAGTAKITERKLTVNIFSDSGVDKVTVTSEYSFSASGYKKPDPLNPLNNVVPISTITGTVTIPEYTVYNITGTEPSGVDAKLENVYLFYYPAYYNVSGDDFLPCEKDTIDIDNSLSSVKSVYLVKQMHPLMMNALGTPEAIMVNGEGSYTQTRVFVSVTSTANVIDLYSNIEDPLTGSGTPKATYTYSQCNNAKLPWAEDTTATPLIYDVVVTIKNSSTGDVECQLTGSTNYKRELEYATPSPTP